MAQATSLGMGDCVSRWQKANHERTKLRYVPKRPTPMRSLKADGRKSVRLRAMETQRMDFAAWTVQRFVCERRIDYWELQSMQKSRQRRAGRIRIARRHGQRSLGVDTCR